MAENHYKKMHEHYLEYRKAIDKYPDPRKSNMLVLLRDDLMQMVRGIDVALGIHTVEIMPLVETEGI